MESNTKYFKYYNYLLPLWKTELLILSLSAVMVALGLVNPYLAKLVIDRAYGNRDLRLFIILICVGGIVFVSSGLLNAAGGCLKRRMRLKVNFELSRKAFKKLQHLPYNFFQDTSTGEHLYRISYDLDHASCFIADVLPQAVLLIPRLALILAIILFLNWKIAALVLALTPFLYIVPPYFNRRLKKSYREWADNSQGIFKKLIEVLSHIQLVKAFGNEKAEIRKYIKARINNTRLGIVSARIENAGLFFNSLFGRIILGLVVFYGGYQVIKGETTLGTLSAITIYLTQLSAAQGSLAQFFQQVSLALVSCERLDVILEAQQQPVENEGSKEIIFPKGGVELRNVCFDYKPGEPVLKDLSFNIKGGSAMALVGPSGCGKTTITNLILRLYPLIKGRILIDGINIADIKANSFYSQIGIVLQEPYLLNDSAGNNIKYGKEDAAPEEIREAAEIACIDEFIVNLPKGYDTLVGESACKISEGQKQRIAIARAVIKRPKILILDEALSSVDAAIEARIIDNIRNSLRDSTLLVVSHRLSTIKSMELVYFLASSDKADIATHDELYLNSPRYRDYLAHQADEHERKNQLTKEPKCYML